MSSPDEHDDDLPRGGSASDASVDADGGDTPAPPPRREHGRRSEPRRALRASRPPLNSRSVDDDGPRKSAASTSTACSCGGRSGSRARLDNPFERRALRQRSFLVASGP